MQVNNEFLLGAGTSHYPAIALFSEELDFICEGGHCILSMLGPYSPVRFIHLGFKLKLSTIGVSYSKTGTTSGV